MKKYTFSIFLLCATLQVVCATGINSVNFSFGDKGGSHPTTPSSTSANPTSAEASSIKPPVQSSSNTLFVQTVQPKMGIIRRLGKTGVRGLIGLAGFTLLLAYDKTRQESTAPQTTQSDHPQFVKQLFGNWIDEGGRASQAFTRVYNDIKQGSERLYAFIGSMTAVATILEKMKPQEQQEKPTEKVVNSPAAPAASNPSSSTTPPSQTPSSLFDHDANKLSAAFGPESTK